MGTTSPWVFGICNHCGVMTAWSRNTLHFLSNFAFLVKRPLVVQFSKFCSESLSPTHRSTLLYSSVVKFVRWEIDEIVRYLPHKKFGSLSNCRYCADRAQNLRGSVHNIWLTMFQISSKSVHFRWSYSRTGEGRSYFIE